MKIIKLYWYNLKMLLRSKEVLFWSIIFPPIMLIIMGTLFPYKGLGVEDERYIQFLTPGLIGLTIMMGSLTVTSARLVRYSQKGMLLRMSLTPLSATRFLIIEMVISMSLIFIQSIIVLLLGKIIFQIETAPLTQFIPAVIAGIIVFTSYGGAISGLTKTAEGVDVLANLIATPMMFLCGVFFSTSQLPEKVKMFSEMLPLTQILYLLRNKTGVYNTKAILVLTLWGILGILLSIFAVKVNQRIIKRG